LWKKEGWVTNAKGSERIQLFFVREKYYR